MQVTRQQILNGAANYIRDEMIPHVPDKGFRVILETVAAMVQMSPQSLESLFENPMVAAVLQEKDGFYDLDILEAALVKGTETHGGLTVTVPKIPFLSKEEKVLTFSANDIRAMKRYMIGQGVTT